MMRQARVVWPLLCGTSLLVATELPDSRTEWSRLRSANFTLYTSAKIAQAKEIALEMETLRAVLASMKKSAGARSPIPTLLFVFPDDDALTPYKPRLHGKPRNIAALFEGGPDGNYIALPARSRDLETRRVVCHEFLHSFLRSNFLPQPLWYDEGLAEFYSTFQLAGSHARFGQVIRRHLQTLRLGPLIPLDRLLAVTRESPEDNEADRQGMFYAESWVLAHYLMHGAPKRTPQLERFLLELQNGRPRDDAFRESFQTDYAGLLGELRLYINGNSFHYRETRMVDLQVPRDMVVERVGYEEILVALGDFLARGEPEGLSDAESHFKAAFARNPGSAGALGGLGFLRLREERYWEAADFFRQAAASGSNDFRTYFYDGQLRMRDLEERPLLVGRLDQGQRQALEESRAAFRKTLEFNGDFAEAHAELGRSFLVEDPSCAWEGIAELETAVRLLPSRTDLALDLATLYERKGDSTKSKEIRDKAVGPEESARLARQAAKVPLQEGLERVRALLAEGREGEAVGVFEQLLATQPEEVRRSLDDRLTALRRGTSRNRAIRLYNEGVVLANKRDLKGALAAFQAVAATAEDPELARQAREQAKILEMALSRKSARRSSTTRD